MYRLNIFYTMSLQAMGSDKTNKYPKIVVVNHEEKYVLDTIIISPTFILLEPP